jgi:3'(2'), 5'-bisphosphate nucleotidase
MRILLEDVVTIARRAACEILDVYASDFRVTEKADASPVTDADERAAKVIVRELAALRPSYPVFCEDSPQAAGGQTPRGRFWLVDPLDGTKEFIRRNGEFTVNIALVEDGQPVLGVVLAPALDRLFAGARSHGAYLQENGTRRTLGCRPAPAEGLTVVASRSHQDLDALQGFLRGRPVLRLVSAGSSLKFCMIAAGEADLYPRLGRTMEWDTAAGHAVLAAAGGRVTGVDGTALVYGKPGLSNPHFIATGH